MSTPDAAPLQARGAAVGYGGEPIVRGLDLSVEPGRITALVGPNGCGKSTVLRALARLLPATEGTILLDGADIAALPTREVARRLGILPQEPVAPHGITVSELIWRGRHPHRRIGQRPTHADEVAIAEALVRTGTATLAHRPVESLSGGQRQRVWIAMALAQQTGVLLLDEPTSYLDVAHQLEVLDLLVDLRDAGTTVLMVLHDLGQAARYADTIVAMRDGRVVTSGPVREVVTTELLLDVFGVAARIIEDRPAPRRRRGATRRPGGRRRRRPARLRGSGCARRGPRLGIAGARHRPR